MDKSSKARLARHCPYCGGSLECFEGHTFCPDCERYTVADPPAYRDDGLLYRPVAVVPWSELTEGDRYALPGCRAVRVRAAVDTPTLWAEYPAAARALHNRRVVLLERVEGDDEILDLVDGDEPLPF
jgi:hypothetical protein